MVPLKPCLTRRGTRPMWSRWVWVRTRWGTEAGSYPGSAQLRSRRGLSPWNIPQSIMRRAVPVSTRY